MELYGIIAISKNILYGRIWYLGRCIPPKKEILKKIELAIWVYIWSNKTGTSRGIINRNNAIRPIDEGGLNAMDLNYNAHITWSLLDTEVRIYGTSGCKSVTKTNLGTIVC